MRLKPRRPPLHAKPLAVFPSKKLKLGTSNDELTSETLSETLYPSTMESSKYTTLSLMEDFVKDVLVFAWKVYGHPLIVLLSITSLFEVVSIVTSNV